MSLAASLSTIEDISALRARWQALEARAEKPLSFFLRWTWAGSWLEALAAAGIALPRLLAVQEDGQDVALALIGHNRAKRKLGSVPALWLNECGDVDGDRPYIEYNGLLCTAGRGQAAADAFCRAIAAQRGWAVLHLSGMSADLPLGQISGIRRCVEADASPAYHVDLSAVRGADGDYLSLLSANSRNQIRRSLKEEPASLCVDRAENAATIAQWLGDMVQLNAGRHQDNAWDNALFRDFALRIAIAGLADGSVELLRITTGGDALGYLLNFVWGGRVMNYQSAFAQPRGPKSKPGLMCHTAAIGRAAQEGFDLYSFLAGKDRYKQSLSTGAEQLRWLVLERFHPLLEVEALARRVLRR